MISQPKLTAVLFDWDGTLVDSYHADSQSYLALFRELGVPWGLAELERYYSPDWYAVYQAADIPREHWVKADQIWRFAYAQHRSRLMSSTRRVLAQLSRGYKLGLVTSGDRSRVTRQLKEFGLTRTFQTRICGGDTRKKKPHPAPLVRALREMKARADECVYVGDTPEDLEMAGAAGVRGIAVLGPFPTEARLRAARPEFLLANLRELPELLRKLYGSTSDGSRKRFADRGKRRES